MSRHSHTAHGWAHYVEFDELSGTVAADTTANGVLNTLSLVDAGAFDETGDGYVKLNGTVYAYTAADLDADTLTLAVPLAANAEEGDRATLCTRHGKAKGDWIAWVELDVGDDEAAELVPAKIRQGLARHVAGNDDHDGDSRGVYVELRRHGIDGDWKVVDVEGEDEVAFCAFESHEPAYTPSAAELTAGSFTHQLSHVNVLGLTVTINGEDLGSDLWTLDAASGTVTVTIPSWVANVPAGRREFGFPMYPYGEGPINDDLPIATEGVGGWRYLQIAKTDAVDRSAVNFDDSSWSVGTSQFANVGTYGTYWAGQTALWVRRTIRTVPAQAVLLTGACDDWVKIYWNGELMYAYTSGPAAAFNVTIPASKVKATNVLAVWAYDNLTPEAHLLIGAKKV